MSIVRHVIMTLVVCGAAPAIAAKGGIPVRAKPVKREQVRGRLYDVWTTTSLAKVFKDHQRPEGAADAVQMAAARNEYEAAQVVFKAIEPISELRCEWGVVKRVATKAGKKPRRKRYEIPRDCLRWNFVGYVPVTKNTQNTPPEELVRQAPADFPDPLLEDRSIGVAAGECQPIWLTVKVPKKAPPGRYEGTFAIISESGVDQIPVTLEVFDFALPDERHIPVTNWFSAGQIAKHHNVEAWSEKHWDLLGRYAENMYEHRQNVCLTPLSLIGISKKADGTFSFDFTRFDRWIEAFEKHGHMDFFEGSHVAHRDGGWTTKNIKFRDFGVTLPDGGKKALPGDEVIRPLMSALQAHLEEEGLVDRFWIHIADEPIETCLASWEEKSRIVHEAAPKIRRIDAIEAPEFHGTLEIWVPRLDHLHDWYDRYKRAQKEQGAELWFYTCLYPNQTYPNRLIDYSLLKTRILHWMNWHFEAPGYLHWGLNHWTDDPFASTQKGNLPPGDAFIIYPGSEGPMNSIRWEAMRDGLEDYEYLHLLAKRTGSRETSTRFTGRLIHSIIDYEHDPAALLSTRREIAEAIVEAGG
ncbi:MAG: glycoside hydrolase domain-containing protein [Armatimonadota bacterium]